MFKEFGKWLTLKELGKGGQGTVYLAANAEQAMNWAHAFSESVKAISRFKENDGAIERVEKSFWFLEAFQQYSMGTWAQMGALKVLHPTGHKESGIEKARKRLTIEIDLLKSLEHHPNLIKVLDVAPEHNWIVFEYFRKGTLESRIKAFKGDPLSTARTLLLLIDGVRLLHEKAAIHRDIKPANIFLSDDGQLVLGDFGLLFPSQHRDSRVTSTHERVGTTSWMPTWLVDRDRPDEVRPTFDVFALGKLLWTLVSGDPHLQLHYYADDRFNLEKRFPNDERMRLVNEIVLSKCLVAEEKDCLANASELLATVKQLVNALQQCPGSSGRVDLYSPRLAGIGHFAPGLAITPSSTTRNQLTNETTSLQRGETQSLFGDDLFLTLLATFFLEEENRYTAKISIGATGEPTEWFSADPGDSYRYRDFEIRVMSISDSYATLRVTHLPVPF